MIIISIKDLDLMAVFLVFERWGRAAAGLCVPHAALMSQRAALLAEVEPGQLSNYREIGVVEMLAGLTVTATCLLTSTVLLQEWLPLLLTRNWGMPWDSIWRKEWLALSHISPSTGLQLQSAKLTPAHALRNSIQGTPFHRCLRSR